MTLQRQKPNAIPTVSDVTAVTQNRPEGEISLSVDQVCKASQVGLPPKRSAGSTEPAQSLGPL
jgi:hypothetical protein